MRSNLAVLRVGFPAQNAHYDLLAGSAPPSLDRLGFPALVHVSGFAAYVGLVGLKLAAAFNERAGLHCETDAMQHEPCGFLRNADRPVDLVGANPILAVSDHPNGDEPLVQRQGAIFKHGANFAGELLLRVLLLALPHPARRDEANIGPAARRAMNPGRPAKLNHRGKRHVRVRKVADGFNKGLGLVAHRPNLPIATH